MRYTSVHTVPTATGTPGSGSGSGSGQQSQHVSNSPSIVVSSFPTSKGLVGGSGGVRPASQTPTFAFNASTSSYSQGSASPSVTQEGSSPVWTGAASRVGALNVIGIAFAVFLSVIVLM